MPLYKYVATATSREEHSESGTVVARTEEEAKKKLKQLRFDQIQVKKVAGLMGLVGQFTANIK